MHTDPIADFITKLRNASGAKRDLVKVPASKLKHAIAELLVKRGFLRSAHTEKIDSKETLLVSLEASHGALAVKRISKPGQRIYVPAALVKRVKNGLGIGIYSTSQGVLSDAELRKRRIGGEYICEVY